MNLPSIKGSRVDRVNPNLPKTHPFQSLTEHETVIEFTALRPPCPVPYRCGLRPEFTGLVVEDRWRAQCVISSRAGPGQRKPESLTPFRGYGGTRAGAFIIPIPGAIARAIETAPSVRSSAQRSSTTMSLPSCPGAGYELIEGHRCASTAASPSRSISLPSASDNQLRAPAY